MTDSDLPAHLRLNDQDMQWLKQCYEAALADEDIDEPFESEVIMTSIGYVELWYDGDVVAFGEVIANVED